MHRRAVRTLLAALAAALLAPASAGAWTITPPEPAPEGDALVFTAQPELGDNPIGATFRPEGVTATPGADFDPSEQPRNGLSGEVTVPVNEDDLDEPDETVRLVPVQGGGEATGTITDDDAPPVLSIGDAAVSEAAGGARLRITASNPSAADITIPLSGRDGTATAADYGVPPSVVLPAGARSVDVTIGIANDADDEIDETFSVLLGARAGATVGDGEGVVTIGNDDLRAVDVADASTPEGDAGTSNLQFVLRLNGPTFRTVTVRYTTGDGLARSPRDYQARTGVVTFAPGQTAATVDVPVVADDDKEPAEAFAIWLTEAGGARLGDAVAVGVIVDDDGGPAPATVDPGDTTPPRLGVGAMKARGRSIVVRVTCPRSERSCAGRVTLFTVADRRSRARALRRERRIGARSFRLSGGGARTLRIRVPASIRRSARRARRLKVQAFAVTQDAAANVDTRTRRATLRYGRRRSR